LPAVAGGHDPRGPMDVEPDVIVADDTSLAGVEPDPNAKRRRLGGRPGCETTLHVHGRRHRIRGAREDRKERVALCPHLDPGVASEGLAYGRAMFVEERREIVAEALEQAGRRLDVAEEERHRPGRQAAHGGSVASTVAE